MNQEAVNFVKEKTEELIAAFSCSAEAKAAADSRQKLYRYLGALGGAALVLVIM